MCIVVSVCIGVSQDQLRDQEDDTEEERIEFLVKVEETIEE